MTAQTGPAVNNEGAGTLPGTVRPDTLAAAIIDALEDDRMTAAEIARQLAKRDVRPTPAQLTVELRRMWTDGLLSERRILDQQCWRVTS